MIIFKTLRFKNFLSTGDKFTEIDFLNTKSTLIVGQNGSGKSTLLDALSFVLFGKAHRNINKPQLVNSVNNKHCIVEVTFQIGSNHFKIIRGIKPQIFEIWQNDQLLNQSSHNKEYQRILEQNIIKLNHKSFHQIVVLGSSSFTPFMQLPASHRRDVIEDLLDITIFSKMNIIIKEKNILLRDKLKDNGHAQDINKTKIDAQDKYIRDLEYMNDEIVQEKEDQIDQYQEDIKVLQKENVTEDEYIVANQKKIEEGLNKAHDQKAALLDYRGRFNQRVKNLVKEAKFYEENEDCPTCSQHIDESLRDEKLTRARERAQEFQEALDQTNEHGAKIAASIEKLNKGMEKVRRAQTKIHANNQKINTIQDAIQKITDEIQKITKAGDLKTANRDLTKLNDERSELLDRRFKLNEEYSYNTIISEMLKDSGIKTKIIKQYVPVINKLVNQYLQILDFFVHFNLDEEFRETIRSRHRDAFTYDSFSEGEKQRIDLALLFTWRQIARMKNSVATNLLILDETFDSSLDHDGVDNLMKILYTLDDNTNVFVISHKGEILEGKFDKRIEFVKEKNFSKIK